MGVLQYIAGHSRPDIAGTKGVLQYITGHSRPDIADNRFMWWIIMLISFGLWYFTLMNIKGAIWITRKTWILVQAGPPFGQFIMVWWVVGHIKVKNRHKEIFQGRTAHYDGMPYRLKFFCQVAGGARPCYKSQRIKKIKYRVNKRSALNRGSMKLGASWCSSCQNRCLVLNHIGRTDKVNPGAPNQNTTAWKM
eukprot:scaffold80439_cov53-Attheya_sp.AAC.1